MEVSDPWNSHPCTDEHVTFMAVFEGDPTELLVNSLRAKAPNNLWDMQQVSPACSIQRLAANRMMQKENRNIGMFLSDWMQTKKLNQTTKSSLCKNYLYLYQISTNMVNSEIWSLSTHLGGSSPFISTANKHVVNNNNDNKQILWGWDP